MATVKDFRFRVTAAPRTPDRVRLAAEGKAPLEAVAARRDVPLSGLAVEAVGHVTRRAEGRLGFVVIELVVDLTVEAELAEAAERAARAAKQRCLVAHALEIPVELELNIHHANERGACDASADLLRAG